MGNGYSIGREDSEVTLLGTENEDKQSVCWVLIINHGMMVNLLRSFNC